MEMPTEKFNGLTSLVLAGQLLGQGPLVVGKAGVRSLSILPGDQTLLEQRLPSGGPPATLPAQGDQTLQTAVLPLNSKGRFADVFLGQTITLSLNGRLNASLLSFGLTSNSCSQAVLAGPDGLKGTADDVLVTNDIQNFTIPAAVLTALSDPALGINDNTVHGLLELANRGLAGMPTGRCEFAGHQRRGGRYQSRLRRMPQAAGELCAGHDYPGFFQRQFHLSSHVGSSTAIRSVAERQGSVIEPRGDQGPQRTQHRRQSRRQVRLVAMVRTYFRASDNFHHRKQFRHAVGRLQRHGAFESGVGRQQRRRRRHAAV